ncbi:MAG: sodium-independent anion transporter [Flavobacteriaceae bacterium]|nr:sodium-independent anion transporter [Flavobacteriaceae bacterium]
MANIFKTNEEESVALFEEELKAIPEGVVLYEINGPLFFGASQKFQEIIADLHQQPKILILRMRNVPFIDATGINRLEEICRQITSKGTSIIISGANHDVKLSLLKADLYTLIDKHNIRDNINSALERAEELLAGEQRSE